MTAGRNEDFFQLDVSSKNLIVMSGYLHFYCPKHPLARQNGTVALHRHLVSVHIGRWLEPDEMVSFRNGDRQDVRIDNLRITDRRGLREHGLGALPEHIEKTCERCNAPFTVVPSNSGQKYCSDECARRSRRLFEVSAEELAQLVWEMPTVKVAELFGVSDKAIEKRCKRLGVSKPPRGYWARVYAGKERDPKLDDPPELARNE